MPIPQKFEEGKPFLQLLEMDNCEKPKKNFSEKLVQDNSDTIIEKVVTKYKNLHDVVSCKTLCFHIIKFLFKNEDKVINFCSLNRLNCEANFDQQVLEDLMDKNYQHVLNIEGFLVRTHEKWNAFIPKMFHRCLTYVLSVKLTGEHDKKTIQVSSIKGTHIHLIDFITVYLTDFCVLLYVSSNSGKTIDECNAMIQSMNSKITNDTWDEEDLGETTDSNIFFLLCYQENKN